MTEEELASIVNGKIDNSGTELSTAVSNRREALFNRYMGEPYGTEIPGYSKFTTREIMEAIEWAMPAMMRIFAGDDDSVEFIPINADDMESAAQETTVVNHLIRHANGGEGFVALYSFIKDALMMPTAYAKVYMEKGQRTAQRKAYSLLEHEFLALVEKDEVTVNEYSTEVKQIPVTDPQTGQESIEEVEVYNLDYQEVSNQPRLRVIPIPGEEVIIDSGLSDLNLDNADFVAHESVKTKSELIKMGYKAEDLEMVDVGGQENYLTWSDELQNRHENDLPFFPANAFPVDDSMLTYTVKEVYLWIDFDGDGIAEYRRVVVIGSKVFDNELCDYQPMVAMCSSIVPHRHIGLSLAEMVEGLQELLTTLTRQLLDNIYKTNANRKLISSDSLLSDGTTMDALLDPLAEWVPVEGPTREAAFPMNAVSIVGDILPVIQHAQDSTSMRTGVAPENNVDPNVLQQSTVGAFMGAMDKAGERIELIARIMAETGIKQIFSKAHKLCRMYPDIASIMRIRGKWVETDPTTWPERDGMIVNVGLGVANKSQFTAAIAQILEIQKEALAFGLSNPEKVYNALARLVESIGLGSVEHYFVDPRSPEYRPPEPQPDPQAELMKAQTQALQQESQRKDMELQINQQMDQMKQQMEQEKLAQAGAMNEAKVATEQQKLDIMRQTEALKESQAAIAAMKEELEELIGRAKVENLDMDTDLKEARIKQLRSANNSSQTPSSA